MCPEVWPRSHWLTAGIKTFWTHEPDDADLDPVQALWRMTNDTRTGEF